MAEESWSTPFPSKDDPKVEEAIKAVVREARLINQLNLVEEHLEKAMQSTLFACLALKVLSKDMTPRMGIIVDKIYETLKEGTADLAIVRWLFTGTEVNKEQIESLVMKKLEAMIAEGNDKK